MKSFILVCCISLASCQAYAQKETAVEFPLRTPAAPRRLLRPSDIFRMKTVKDCQVSPEGNWIAYTMTIVDSAKDKALSHIWMSSWDGQTNLQITNGAEGDESPHWSPDGKYLSFLSDRSAAMDKEDDNKGHETGKLWLLDRRGGEAIKLLEVKGKLLEYAWSPDARKIALVIKDPDLTDTAKTKIRKPFVMDRFHFKQDIEGYLEGRYTHLYLFDLASRRLDTLTRGKYDESSPAWSPDSRQLAFVSNRTADPDKNENKDIWLMNISGGGAPVQLTTWRGPDIQPVWSPDGSYLAYLQANSEDSFTIYNHYMLAIIPRQGGIPRLLSRDLDRPVTDPKWSKDGSSIGVIVTDDRQSYPAAFSVKDGSLHRLAGGDCSYSQLEYRKDNDWATIMSTPLIPGELYGLQGGNARRITHTQDNYLAPLALATVKGFQSISEDSTKVSGILYTPAGYTLPGTTLPGKVPPGTALPRLPLILFIHGGPSAQDDYGFDLERQTLAAAGFAVAAVNYRGSNGRGADYCRTIYADWGNKEVKDILGAANFLVAQDIVDSTRMGIAGWSYGGILTDYVIATDTRFKAASSGAGSALQLSMWGVDEYINQYNNELGTPWTHLDKWLALSYPFLKADRIKTPTLFMASQSDFNVPSVGAEQMYQALRTLGIPAQLVIYPGQFHEITVPSYQVDRLQRWLDWFRQYLK